MAQNAFDQFDAAPAVSVTPLPESVGKRREAARDDRGEVRDDTRLGVTLRGERRQGAQDGFDNAAKLRTEFQKLPQVVDYQTVIRQYASALKTQPNPTGDQALITAYAKMLDPGSVVREQEFNTVQAGDSTIGQVIAKLNKEFGADAAGLLRPEVRSRVKQEMQNLTSSYNQSYNQARTEYGKIAQGFGVSPDVVLGGHYGEPYYPQIQSELQRIYGANAPRADAATSGETSPDEAGGLTGTVTDDRPLAKPGTAEASVASQIGSGLNEGLASTAGLPVDAMAGVMNLGIRGYNAATNSDAPYIEKPFGGSDWFKGALTDTSMIRRPSADPKAQFARRVSQSLGASALPGVGLARTPMQAGLALASGVGGGIGGATAQRVAPGNVGAEMLGEVLGSGTGMSGIIGRSRQLGQREIEMGIPTVDQLKQQAGDLYRQAEARGVTAEPMQTQALSDTLRGVLKDEGLVSPTGRMNDTYAKAKEGIGLADDYAGNVMNPTQMQTVRRIMAEGLGSPDANERRIAGKLTETFDDWANPMAPELPQARDIASRYLNAQTLEKAREMAAVNSGYYTGSGFENALRTQYRGLDRQAVQGKGRYSMDMNEAIQAVNRGTPASNAARNIGKLAPTGVVSAGLGMGVPAMVGTAMGGPGVGMAIGAGTGIIGSMGRVAATELGLKNARNAELIARNGGALPQYTALTPDIERLMAGLAIAQSGQALDKKPAKPQNRK